MLRIQQESALYIYIFRELRRAGKRAVITNYVLRICERFVHDYMFHFGA